MIALAIAATLRILAGPPEIGVIHNQDYKFGDGYHLDIVTNPLEAKLDQISIAYCSQSCRGGKHVLHAECDASCDRACTEIHQYELHARASLTAAENDAAYNKLREKLSELKKQMPHGSIIEGLEKDAFGKDKASHDVSFKWKHWNSKQCSYAVRRMMGWVYPVECHWTISQDVKDAEGKPTVKEIASGKMFAYIKIPTDQFEDRPATEVCRCQEVEQDEEDPPTPHKMSFDPPETAFIEKCGPPEVPCSGSDLKKFDFSVECTDMNQGVCTATNFMPMPVDLCMQEGTVLECVDESDQDTLCVEGCRLHLIAANPIAGICGSGFVATPVSAPIRLQCLNLHKGQPSRSKKYVPVTGSDALVKLAKFQKKQLIAGPWDQIRTWIYTDHASLDEIAKVMLPPPSEGAYLKAAYQLSTLVPTIDWGSEPYRHCLEPTLIVGNVASREATSWLVGELARIDPVGLANWVDTHAAEFAPLWTNANLAVNPKHLADVASALCESKNAQVRASGRRFLLGTVPSDKRALIAANRGLEGLAFSMVHNPDAAEVDEALAVAEAYPSASIAFGLLNLDKGLPEATRARAAKLLRQLAN